MTVRPKAITIALLAMGGEGGGVLADWLVSLAEENGFVVQATSIPGVAQRTGATLYYLEMFPAGAVPEGAAPVLGLGPVPGELDVVIASELMEAGRALQRGLVSSDRTAFIFSTHRVFSMTERTAMGDGRVDSDKLIKGAAAAARRAVAADFQKVAEDSNAPISAVLYGALAASGALPFNVSQFEASIRKVGLGVASSTSAFLSGVMAVGNVTEGVSNELPKRVGRDLEPLVNRIDGDFPPNARSILRHGIVRLSDYQDVQYASEYLDRLTPLVGCPTALLIEVCRHLALWMSYEDTVRVADLKTRSARFSRVAAEVKLQGSQLLRVNEYLHPRLQEVADTLPVRLGTWLLNSRKAQAVLAPFLRKGRVVRTSSLRGYLLLFCLAQLRPLRRSSLRYKVEHADIDAWLARIYRLAPGHPDLALSVVHSQRLVKGYGDTHSRGRRNFWRLMSVLPQLEQKSDGHLTLNALIGAALKDEEGQELERQLRAL